ncbi:MAG TPA: GAF domain-containing sensor histidine kinase [Kofleriaceae bacterium]
MDAVAAVQRIEAVPTILRLIAELTGLRLSMVAEVTEDRWRCCAVLDKMDFGLQLHGELDVHTTLCKEVRAAQQAIVIPHASVDTVYGNHPTPKLYQFESYISVPIFLRDKRYFGTLCGLDSRPLDLTDKTRAMFEVFAELIGIQLDLEIQHGQTTRALLDERETGELREQFIAMLGHDLRNPLSAIQLGTQVLAARQTTADAPVIARIARSTGKMAAMVDDLLDFTRGRLGGGMTLELTDVTDLDDLLRGVIDELRNPARPAIELDAPGDPPRLRCDRGRVGQAVSNLIANALQHGDRISPIQVTRHATAAGVRIDVANRGPSIPAERLASIFQPYQRGASAAPRDGLGLGLYIVSEVARAHHGHVDCTSRDGHTTFSLVLPRDPDRA